MDDCKSLSTFDLFTIIQTFANNLYIPDGTNTEANIWTHRILPAILNNDNLKQIQPSYNVWLPFTLQLATLGHFDQPLISRVLSTAYLDKYINRKDINILDLHKVLVLYQTVAMQPNVDMTFVERKSIEKVFKRYADQMPSCDIQADLIEHVGRACVLTNIRSKYMHLIPTLVKINKTTRHLERFSDDIVRDADGFVSLDSIPCGENEEL